MRCGDLVLELIQRVQPHGDRLRFGQQSLQGFEIRAVLELLKRFKPRYPVLRLLHGFLQRVDRREVRGQKRHLLDDDLGRREWQSRSK